MTIRNLQPNDAAQVALLIRQLTKNIVEPEKLEARIAALSLQGNSQFLVAESEEGIVGFGGLVWYQIPSKGLIGWVEEVVVDENHRGQGIGTTLMQQMLVLAEQKKVRQIKLTSTPTAQRLYEKLGFVKKGQDYLIKNIATT